MELKEQLDALKVSLEAKNAEEVKNAITAFESKFNEAVAKETKAVREELTAQLDEVKKHANELDVKLQAKAKADAQTGDSVKDAISANFENIKNADQNKVRVKAVGDMTLVNNLTGDQPRDYSFDVVMKPGQKVNSEDLISSIAISGGTYTYPKEVSSEGGFAFQTDESADKSRIDYDLEMTDVSTDFLAGLARYSKKMRNNLPFLESFLPRALRRDYYKQENAEFYSELETEATASTLVSTDYDTPVEQILQDKALLLDADYEVTGIVVRPSTWNKIRNAEKSSGAGYGFPSQVEIRNGVMYLDGVPVFQATWIPENKYVVGDWSMIYKVITEGLGLEFSSEEGDNFKKNQISARLEAQIAWAFKQPASLILGDITATL